METEVLVKFLRHLMSCTEVVLQKEEIESYDISSLRRELAQLKRHIDGNEKIDPRILDQILGLELKVDEGLLADSKKGTWVAVVGLIFHRSPLGSREHSRRLEELKRQVSQFRNDIDRVRFALEF